MALYHLVNTLTNGAGDKLVGYYVRLRVATEGGQIAPLYSDSNSTPIDTVSGVVNAAKTDSTGLYSIYVQDGSYDIQIYDKNDINTLVRIIEDVPMYGFNSAADALAAAASATAAAASETAAELAQTATESARDEVLAYGNTPPYVTWSDAAAATGLTAGDLVLVLASDTGTHTDPVVGGTVDNAGVFRYSASPAGLERVGDLESQLAEGFADSAAASVDAVESLLDQLLTTASLGLSAITTSATTLGAAAGTYVLTSAAVESGALATLRVRNARSSGFTIKWRKYTTSSLTATPVSGSSWQSLSVPAGPGNTDFDLSDPIAAGECIAVSVPNDKLHYLSVSATGNEASYYLYSSTQDADGFTAGGQTTTVQLQVGVDYNYPTVTGAEVDDIAADLAVTSATVATHDAILDDIADRSLGLTGTPRSGPVGGDWAPPTFYEWAIPITVGVDVAAGTVIAGVGPTLRYTAASGVVRFEAMLCSRPTGGGFLNSLPENAGDTEEWSDWVSVDTADLSFGADTFGKVSFSSPDGEAPVAAADKFYYLRVRSFTSADVQSNIGCAKATVAAGLVQSRRGWYRPTSAVTAWTNIPDGFSLAIEIYTYIYTLNGNALAVVPTHYGDLITDVSFDVNGLNLTTTLTIARDGSTENTHVDSARAITAATSGNHRYDVLYFSPETNSFGVVAGTNRQYDACEYIPAIGGSSRLLVAHLRVSDTALTVLPMWRVVDGVDSEIAAQVATERAAARARLPKFLAKVARGASVKIIAFGDSIQAMQSDVPSTPNTPNGTVRDRATASGQPDSYLRSAIQGDTISALAGSGGLLELFTATALGWADDGLGAAHTKFGFTWELVKELDRRGYTLGSDLFYDNFARGGWASAQAVSGGSASSWTTAAVASAADLAIVHLGMNEYNNTSTEANMVIALNAFRAAGIEVIVMGVELKNSGQSLTGWEYTNRALRRAAEYTGCAFVSAEPLYDPRFQGLGIAPADRCSANRINHPGIREHDLIGKALIRTVFP